MKKKIGNIVTLAAASFFAMLGLVFALSPIVPTVTLLSIPTLTTIPFTFVNGTVANATQVNSNFTSFQTQINASIAAIQTQTNAALTQIQTQVNAFETGGSWTPADVSGGGLTFTGVSAGYTRHGNMVLAYATLTYPFTGDGNIALIGGLPVAAANVGYAGQCFVSRSAETTIPQLRMGVVPGGTNINLWAGSGASNNTQMSTATLTFECIYPAS